TTLESLPVNGGFLGVVVPSGPVRVKITYRPMSFIIGTVLFLLAVAAMIIYVRGMTLKNARFRSTATVLVLVAAGIGLTGCEDRGPVWENGSFPVYPEAERLDRMTRLFMRAHEVTYPDLNYRVELRILSTPDPIEEVAAHYADLYGFHGVAEDYVNNFSAIPPKAYFTEGDLHADLVRIEPLLERFGIEIDPSTIEGTYRGAHIDEVGNAPRVTLQRPYVDPTRGEVVDETLILLVRRY
ncbi:MAG: hypothetical protein R3338_03645, partial [Thermoanaerobaculia bacterium]|nr:hypothetical protein [Thermoanaerobaculia bacterium]